MKAKHRLFIVIVTISFVLIFCIMFYFFIMEKQKKMKIVKKWKMTGKNSHCIVIATERFTYDAQKHEVVFLKYEMSHDFSVAKQESILIGFPIGKQPENNGDSERQRNLIVNDKTDNMTFLYYLGDNKWKYIKFLIDKNDNTLVLSENRLMDIDYVWSCYKSAKLDLMGEKLLSYNGKIQGIPPENQTDSNIFQNRSSEKKIQFLSSFIKGEFIDSDYPDDDFVISQTMDTSATPLNSKLYPNLIFLTDLKKQKVANIQYEYFPGYLTQGRAAISVSNDSKQLGFLTCEVKGKENSEEWAFSVMNIDKSSFQNSKISKIVSLARTQPALYINRPYIMKWSKMDKYIALFDGNTTLIIDVEKRKIIKNIVDKSSVRNLNWSPDEENIALLYDDGRLLVLNMKNQNIRVVLTDPDCFDFFWVE